MGITPSYMIGTPGPSGFGSKSTAEDVTANMDLRSKTIIVTGATSGIGKEAARVLAKRGAHVIFAVRNVKLGEIVSAEILLESPTARVDVMHLDLNSLTSVREFVENFKARKLPLNILLNNAGLIYMKFRLSQDGVEETFAVNHLGHFLLTNLLLDTMKITAKETGVEGRIVNVASEAYKMSYNRSFALDKLNDPKRFFGAQAYGQSKLANILHARELARRLQGEVTVHSIIYGAGEYSALIYLHLKEEGVNVTANALHPGTINTGFGSNVSVVLKGVACTIFAKFLKTIPQATGTSCYVATSPALNGVSGKYFQDCNEVSTWPCANDMQLADKLWQFSEELIASTLTK